MLRAFRRNALLLWPRRDYEEGVVARRFFGRAMLLLNVPDAIQHVLLDNDANYRRTPATIRILWPIIGDGLFLSTGEAWRHQRRTLAPAFAPKALPLLVPHIRAASEEAADALAAQGETPLDLLAALQHLALEIAGRTMFSLEMSQHGPALRRRFGYYARHLARPNFLDIVMPPTVPSPRDLARLLFRHGWMRLIEAIIAERTGRPPDDGAPRDLLDLLRAARDPETNANFTATQLRDQVATMIIAGHETTAVALFWSLYLLARAPETQERVAAEACAAGLDAMGPSTLPWTRAVLDEALRLYPPAYTIVRRAIQRDVVAGIPVEPGAALLISPWVLHRHRRLWSEPDAFDPTRFLAARERPAPVHRFQYLPFGVGPRICIGAAFALTEATLVLATLLRRFRVALVSSRPVLPVAIVTTQPDHAPLFRLERR
jgi:unspecific monooxygenase